jgi:hypothetical protein
MNATTNDLYQTVERTGTIQHLARIEPELVAAERVAINTRSRSGNPMVPALCGASVLVTIARFVPGHHRITCAGCFRALDAE